MSKIIAVKHVEESLYRKAKAVATIQGKPMGQVLNEALTAWLNSVTTSSSAQLPNAVEAEAEQNNRCYRSQRAKLLTRHRGKYVAISGGQVLGVYRNAAQAARAVRKAGGHHGIVTRLDETPPRTVELGWSLLELPA